MLVTNTPRALDTMTWAHRKRRQEPHETFSGIVSSIIKKLVIWTQFFARCSYKYLANMRDKSKVGYCAIRHWLSIKKHCWIIVGSEPGKAFLRDIEVFTGSFFERSFRPQPDFTLRAGALITMNELIDYRQQKPNLRNILEITNFLSALAIHIT